MARTRALMLSALLASAAAGACGGGPPVPEPPAPPPPGADRERPLRVHRTGDPPVGSLPFYYDLYTFRGVRGGTAVVASFAVHVGRLDRERVGRRARYRFNVGLILADPERGDVYRADDSVHVTTPRPLAEDHLLHAFLETEAPPSTSTVQRVLMIDAPYPGTGQLYTHPFAVPDYRGDDLMLSDVALGLPDRTGGWKRGRESLALLPSDNFPGGDFDVYYEIYNLPRGNRYTTEIAFEALGGGGEGSAASEPVRVRFTGESGATPGGTVSERRRVSVPAEPGRYRLTVAVTDLERGLTVRQSKRVRIRPWREGATLVPTCPVRVGVSRAGCGGRVP